jgi:hypothetical protein
VRLRCGLGLVAREVRHGLQLRTAFVVG